MFNSLFNSLFGKSKDNNSSNLDDQSDFKQSDQQNDFHETDSNVTAILLEEDKDWLFVEKEGEDDSNSIGKATNNLQLVPFKNILSHLGSISENDENCFLTANLPSIYPNSMDDSWFLTPPECFTSVSSIQLESSPLENLLIEHPSMSVYYNFRRGPLNSITNNNEAIDDLVVIEMSHNDIDGEQFEKIPNKNRDRKNNKKSRQAGAPKNVALVLIKKNSVPKTQDQRKPVLSKAATERNNKCYALRHAPKRTTVINQPSQRMMIKKN